MVLFMVCSLFLLVFINVKHLVVGWANNVFAKCVCCFHVPVGP
jgi:hypothetical protein